MLTDVSDDWVRFGVRQQRRRFELSRILLIANPKRRRQQQAHQPLPRRERIPDCRTPKLFSTADYGFGLPCGSKPDPSAALTVVFTLIINSNRAYADLNYPFGSMYGPSPAFIPLLTLMAFLSSRSNWPNTSPDASTSSVAEWIEAAALARVDCCFYSHGSPPL
jgi:hypothetical protein